MIKRYRAKIGLSADRELATPVMVEDENGGYISRHDHLRAMKEAMDSRTMNIDAMQETNLRLTRELAVYKEHRDALARCNNAYMQTVLASLSDANQEIARLKRELESAWGALQDLTLKTIKTDGKERLKL